MANAATDGWSLDADCPPMLATEYRKMARKVVAEWLRLARVTCAEDYHLTQIVEQIQGFVVNDLKAQAVRHSLPVGDLIVPLEEER
jgi:hypothetical protein